jgi:hypothetical protein
MWYPFLAKEEFCLAMGGGGAGLAVLITYNINNII